MKKLLLLLLSGLLLMSCKQTSPQVNPNASTSMDGSHLLSKYAGVSLAGKTATLYKSKNCGCCEGYAQALRDAGVNITVVPDNTKLSEIKDQHKITEDMQSCHTTIIDGYFVEGHVPLNVVRKLLEEKPKIDGITLPGMPIGTPGMDGVKTQIFEIESITNGQNSVYLQL